MLVFLTRITRWLASKMSIHPFDWFKTKKVEEPHAQYRIVKEEWPDGKVLFSIEEWSHHYAVEKPFWMGMYLIGGLPNCFKTQEEASAYLTKMLTPPPKPVITVVEER